MALAKDFAETLSDGRTEPRDVAGALVETACNMMIRMYGKAATINALRKTADALEQGGYTPADPTEH